MDSTAILAAWEIDGEIAGGWRNWPALRKSVAAEQVALTKSGDYSGEIDGYAGPATSAARLAFAGRQSVTAPTGAAPPTPTIAPTTKDNPRPWPLQDDCDAFYGNPRGGDGVGAAWCSTNLVRVRCPWVLHMDAITLHDIEIHRQCADSLTRVLSAVWEACGKDQSKIESLHYDRYSGSFNYRPMRGGSRLSMHSYGVAIDWDSEENLQHAQKHLFQSDSLLVVKFKEEQWQWGGDWGGSSVDSMHVQAARVHP